MTTAPVLPASPAPTPQSAPLSEGARIANTFVAPSKTFTDLRRNASWWGPWLLISIFSMLFIYAMGRQVGFEQISRNQVAHSSRAEQFEKLPADQQAKQIQLSSKIIRSISPFLCSILNVLPSKVFLTMNSYTLSACLMSSALLLASTRSSSRSRRSLKSVGTSIVIRCLSLSFIYYVMAAPRVLPHGPTDCPPASAAQEHQHKT